MHVCSIGLRLFLTSAALALVLCAPTNAMAKGRTHYQCTEMFRDCLNFCNRNRTGPKRELCYHDCEVAEDSCFETASDKPEINTGPDRSFLPPASPKPAQPPSLPPTKPVR